MRISAPSLSSAFHLDQGFPVVTRVHLVAACTNEKFSWETMTGHIGRAATKTGLESGCCEWTATGSATDSKSKHADPTSKIFEVSSKIATRVRQSVRRTRARFSEPMSLQKKECYNIENARTFGSASNIPASLYAGA
jgi:hypothetical protein